MGPVLNTAVRVEFTARHVPSQAETMKQVKSEDYVYETHSISIFVRLLMGNAIYQSIATRMLYIDKTIQLER